MKADRGGDLTPGQAVEALGEAIDAALASVTPGDCRGFFRHCGYPAT